MFTNEEVDKREEERLARALNKPRGMSVSKPRQSWHVQAHTDATPRGEVVKSTPAGKHVEQDSVDKALKDLHNFGGHSPAPSSPASTRKPATAVVHPAPSSPPQRVAEAIIENAPNEGLIILENDAERKLKVEQDRLARWLGPKERSKNTAISLKKSQPEPRHYPPSAPGSTVPAHHTTTPVHNSTVPAHTTTVPSHSTTVPAHNPTVPAHNPTPSYPPPPVNRPPTQPTNPFPRPLPPTHPTPTVHTPPPTSPVYSPPEPVFSAPPTHVEENPPASFNHDSFFSDPAPLLPPVSPVYSPRNAYEESIEQEHHEHQGYQEYQHQQEHQQQQEEVYVSHPPEPEHEPISHHQPEVTYNYGNGDGNGFNEHTHVSDYPAPEVNVTVQEEVVVITEEHEHYDTPQQEQETHSHEPAVKVVPETPQPTAHVSEPVLSPQDTVRKLFSNNVTAAAKLLKKQTFTEEEITATLSSVAISARDFTGFLHDPTALEDIVNFAKLLVHSCIALRKAIGTPEFQSNKAKVLQTLGLLYLAVIAA